MHIKKQPIKGRIRVSCVPQLAVGRGAKPASGPPLAWRVLSRKLEAGVSWVGHRDSAFLSGPGVLALAWGWHGLGMQNGGWVIIPCLSWLVPL